MSDARKPVEVLEDIDWAARELGAENLPNCANQMRRVHAAVAELIEADIEYDAAFEALASARLARGNWRADPVDGLPEDAQAEAAEKRRAAALAACRGGAHGR